LSPKLSTEIKEKIKYVFDTISIRKNNEHVIVFVFYMETFISPSQLPTVNTINLNYHRRSAYWIFIIGFLGIISFAILGLYAISAYEQSEQARMGDILHSARITQFFPIADQNK